MVGTAMIATSRQRTRQLLIENGEPLRPPDGRGVACGRGAVTASLRQRNRQSALSGVAGGARAALAWADGQRSALRRGSASVERKIGGLRLQTAVSVGHRTSTHCAYTSQLQGQPGQAQGNSSS